MIDEIVAKILIANSQPVYEREEDDDIDLVAKAEIEADCNSVINSIGTPDFKSIFLMTSSDIKSQELDIQIDLCCLILDKVRKVYDFDFPTNIEVRTKNDIDQIYTFIKWLEYDNEEYMTLLLSGLISDLRRINIKTFILSNWEKLTSRFFVVNGPNDLCNNFIRTNNKENIIKFLNKCIKNNRISITEKLLMLEIERGRKNE